jgi:hypothetical protein
MTSGMIHRRPQLLMVLTLAACGHAVESPGTVTFELQNQDQAAIFVQAAQNCAGQTWVSILEPDDREVGTEGGRCATRCGEQPIACPALCVLPEAKRLATGERTETTWDAIIYRTSGSCVIPVAADPQLSYRAKFCWGTGSSTVSGDPLVTDVRCATEAFTVGGSVRVRHLVP